MQDSTAKRWRTYTHPCVGSANYGCCQIIDSRTGVIHLVALSSHHLHRAKLNQTKTDPHSISRALWPTATEKRRGALPQMLTDYLYAIRGEELSEPCQERQMFSFTIYNDGSHSWPAITLMTQDNFVRVEA